MNVYIADECFLTGSAAEVIPVVKVDSRQIGTGKARPYYARTETNASTVSRENRKGRA